ncbi:MAG: ABC-type dipeptide transport system, periplasmic component [Herbinix sp.]|jgi:peptide/nickel transport system substrate-binding protein|nr:ABC-type dipeptide transport system, periplasmic component [Herbinix sp.]
MRTKRTKSLISLLLILVIGFLLVGCSSKDSKEGSTTGNSEVATNTGTESTDAKEKVVNIGVTDTLKTLNPLLIDAGEVNKYSTGMMFLPLVDLGPDLNFEPMLADSITTEDNIHFKVHIDDDATWSDGTPITADDVVFTALRLTSPVVANPSLMYFAFEGVGDDGFVAEGATSIPGIVALDNKTVQFTAKYPMALTTFENTYARYLLTLPKHILENVAEADLATYDWFNHPDVVSGPFFVTDFDVNHYISYTKNDNYWKGKVNIDKLNIKIVTGSQLYAGLQSGEIDFVQQTMGVIPQEDYANIEALENINAVYGEPVTNQSVFFQTKNDAISDPKVRQAILYGIDRNQLVSGLLNGKGEVVDGFLSSASPFYDSSLVPTEYNPEKAKQLLAEAGWDGSKTLRFYVNSGDTTFVNGASVIAAQLGAIGIKVEIQTVDFTTLMTVVGTTDYDLLAVQYTYAPIDPYPDVNWLLSGEGSWTGYSNSDITAALAKTQLTSDVNEIKGYYLTVDQKVQQDIPMFSAYVIKALGAVNKRLVNATPSVYGSFNHIENWDIVE